MRAADGLATPGAFGSVACAMDRRAGLGGRAMIYPQGVQMGSGRPNTAEE